MKKKLYVIKARYQYVGDGGPKWTSWFIQSTHERTKEEAEEYVEEIKTLYGDIDKKTKLNHEYALIPAEDYAKEMEELRAEIAKDNERNEKYYASDKWKELKHKKYVARKEEKKRQAEYNEMKKQLTDNV